MTNPRVAVRFAENAVERAIRQVALLAHGMDNNATSGPCSSASVTASGIRTLFPHSRLSLVLPPCRPQWSATASLS